MRAEQISILPGKIHAIAAAFAIGLFFSGLMGTALSQDAKSGILKRELKFVPVAEVLPVAEIAISRFLDSGDKPVEISPQRGKIKSVEGSIVGETLLFADFRANRLIVYGSPEHREIVNDLIDELDVRPEMIQISVVVIKVKLGKESKHAFDVLSLAKEITVDGDKVDVARAFNPQPSEQIVRLKPGQTLSAKHFKAYCDALETVSKKDVQVMTQATVSTASTKQALISQGVEGAGLMKLEIVPRVAAEKKILLELTHTIETRVAGKMKTHALATSCETPDKVALAIGGLIEEAGGERSELLVLLRPEIVELENQKKK